VNTANFEVLGIWVTTNILNCVLTGSLLWTLHYCYHSCFSKCFRFLFLSLLLVRLRYWFEKPTFIFNRTYFSGTFKWSLQCILRLPTYLRLLRHDQINDSPSDIFLAGILTLLGFAENTLLLPIRVCLIYFHYWDIKSYLFFWDVDISVISSMNSKVAKLPQIT
jgi:hypothetical protein